MIAEDEGSPVFQCPECQSLAFFLAYEPIPDPKDAPPGTLTDLQAARLELLADNSPLKAICSTEGCDFRTSVTEIKIGMHRQAEKS